MPNNYKLNRDEQGKILSISTNVCGHELLDNPRLNKGSAFTSEERELYNLSGKLPFQIETIEEQVERTYQQYLSHSTNLAKNIHLNNLHDTNETLFYRLVGEHLEEMLPIIYTPTVGEAVEKFSLELRQPRGLYIAYPDMDKIEEMLCNRTNQNIDLIVVTDGEGVLGIGDQGIGGMDISVAKLMVYVIGAGVNPHRKLPIILDVGTNNEKLLNDPMYLGWRHKRISGSQYDKFIDKFVTAVNKNFANAYLHWEDFGRENAHKNLIRYRDHMLTFNDDIQGTGAVTLAAVLAGVHAANRKLCDERIVFLGAGTAGTGIADQICAAMIRNGLSEEEARMRFWLIDRPGLLVDNMDELTSFQKPYARAVSEIADWKLDNDHPQLLDVVKNVKPTILVGCSTVTGAFNQEIVKTMAAHIERPIIMPLSNPTSKAEAHPSNIIRWTEGKALIATGSPFEPVEFNDKTIRISQCNNAFIFPGIGLGVIACRATRLTSNMIWEASKTLAACSPVFEDSTAPLLPNLQNIRDISRNIAKAVIEQARKDNVTAITDDVDPDELINQIVWKPKYYSFKKDASCS